VVGTASLALGRYSLLLSHRPYRLYFTSSTLGAFASTIEFLGLGWVMLSVAPSAWGIVLFLGLRLGIKSLMAAPAGIMADRLPRNAIYAWMRVACGIAALAGAFAAAADSVTIAILAISLSAVAHAIDLPAHRALMAQVQPDDMLERGLSFGSSGFHVAALLAPVVALPLATLVGPPAPLLLAAIVFLVASLAAFRIDVEGVRPDDRAPSASHLDAIATALRFVWRTPLVVLLLLATALPGVIDKTIVVMLPSVTDAEHAAFGLVLAAPELGAIVLGLTLAGLQWRFSPWITASSAVLYAGSIAVTSSVGLEIGGIAVGAGLFVAGCAKTALITSALAGIQRTVPPHLMGRIMTV
jgi:MFS family permease